MANQRVSAGALLCAVVLASITSACTSSGVHDSHFWSEESVAYAIDAPLRIGGVELQDKSVREAIVRANSATLYCAWVRGIGPTSKREFSTEEVTSIHRGQSAAIDAKLDQLRLALRDAIPGASWRQTRDLLVTPWDPSAVSSLCEIDMGLANPDAAQTPSSSGLYRVVVRLFYYWVPASRGGGEGVFRVGTLNERNVNWVLEFSADNGRTIVRLLDELVSLK